MKNYDKYFKRAIIFYCLIMFTLGGLATAYISQAPERAAKLQGKTLGE